MGPGTSIRGTLGFNTYDFGLLIADMTNFGPAGFDVNDHGVVEADATLAGHRERDRTILSPRDSADPGYARGGSKMNSDRCGRIHVFSAT